MNRKFTVTLAIFAGLAILAFFTLDGNNSPGDAGYF